MRISHFGVSCFFFVFSSIMAITPRLLQTNGYNMDWFVNAFIYFCAIIMLFFAILYGRYYILTEQSINHKLLGICYRKTYWQDIRDVMYVYQQTGEKYKPRTLMFTTKHGNVYRPDKSGYIKDNNFHIDWLLGKIFMIRCDDLKSRTTIIPYVEAHYGKIDYSFEEWKTGDGSLPSEDSELFGC